MSFSKLFYLVPFIVLSFIFSNCPDGTDVCLSLDASSLNYDSSADIAGFQFGHDGCATEASGGDAGAAGFMISASGTVVLGFSLTGAVIPAGIGTLVDLGSTDCIESSLSDFVFSDSDGLALAVAWSEVASGCMDETACNGSAMEDCAGECNGDAVEDECGECGGDETDPTQCIQDGYSLDLSNVIPGNGFWDEGEDFIDVDSNGMYDIGEEFTDIGSLDLIAFFAPADTEGVPLDSLSKKGNWARKKMTAKKRAEEIIQHLLHLYVKRRGLSRPAFSQDPSLEGPFLKSFPFEDTPDQVSA